MQFRDFQFVSWQAIAEKMNMKTHLLRPMYFLKKKRATSCGRKMA